MKTTCCCFGIIVCHFSRSKFVYQRFFIYKNITKNPCPITDIVSYTWNSFYTFFFKVAAGQYLELVLPLYMGALYKNYTQLVLIVEKLGIYFWGKKYNIL